MSWKQKFEEYKNNNNSPTLYEEMLFDMENYIEEEKAHAKFFWLVVSVVFYICVIISNIP